MELARTASVKERQRVALLLAETERLERDAQQAEAELLQVQQEIAQLAVARQTPLPLWHYCSAGHFCAPVDLPADLVAAAEAKLGETPQRRLEALATLRQRCDEATLKSGLEFVRSDDQFLVAFLRAKQFDVTRAFECILKYIELVAEVADEDASLRRDGGLSHSEMGQLYALKILELLPGTAVDGSRIALVRGALFTDEMLATLSAAPDGGRAGDRPLRFLLWLFTRLISDPYVAVNGLTMVEDLADMPLMACVRFARSLDKGPKRRMMRLVQSALPIRFNSFYMVNAPSQLSWVLWSAGPFLSKKMKERIILASDLLAKAGPAADQDEMSCVAGLVGRGSLPVSFGGSIEPAALSASWWEHQRQDGGGGVTTAEELGIEL